MGGRILGWRDRELGYGASRMEEKMSEESSAESHEVCWSSDVGKQLGWGKVIFGNV